MSEETLRASLMSTGPLIAWPALWRTWLASIRSEPVSLKIVFGALRWSCRAGVGWVGGWGGRGGWGVVVGWGSCAAEGRRAGGGGLGGGRVRLSRGQRV